METSEYEDLFFYFFIFYMNLWIIGNQLIFGVNQIYL